MGGKGAVNFERPGGRKKHRVGGEVGPGPGGGGQGVGGPDVACGVGGGGMERCYSFTSHRLNANQIQMAVGILSNTLLVFERIRDLRVEWVGLGIFWGNISTGFVMQGNLSPALMTCFQIVSPGVWREERGCSALW